MRKIAALGALFVGLLAACGGKKDPMVMTADAAPMMTGTCDPVKQTGCGTGEKCTWVRTVATQTEQHGVMACVKLAAAPVALNGACAYGASGTATGYDNCDKGLICSASSAKEAATGACVGICDTTGLTSADGACATNYACAKYNAYFANDGDTPNNIGLCDPTCDPLTHKRDFDGAAACGGKTDAQSNETVACLGFPGADNDPHPSEFTCGGSLHPSFKAGQLAYDATYGGVFANSCGAGFVPLLYQSTADAVKKDEMKVICVGYCEPVATSSETPTSPGGNKATKHSCQDVGYPTTAECHYWWWFEDHDGMDADTAVSKWSNGLGFCQDLANAYTYDDTKFGGTNKAQPIPSCTKLSTKAFKFDPSKKTDDATFWGCQPVPEFTTLTAAPHASALVPLLAPAQMLRITTGS